MSRVKVLRVYHSGRDAAHRQRERALLDAGAEVTLVVPTRWAEGGSEAVLSPEPFDVVEWDVDRPGDVNRHRYRDEPGLRALLARVGPDVLDLHEEPFSVVSAQWLRLAPDVPVVMYTAQNVDKRFPPPFAQYEKRALRRVSAMYPCSRQAASVVRGKGFGGSIEVLPLGIDPLTFWPGAQVHAAEEFVMVLVGRMVREKGVLDAVHALAGVLRTRPARLVLIGRGPMVEQAFALATTLGVRVAVEYRPWCSAAELAEQYRSAHLVLMPSTRTATWVEQFGRVILEAQASGTVVLGYASGTIPEVGGDAAVTVAEGDREALAAAAVRLAESPETFDALRRAGLARVATRTWADVARQQVALYARVVDGTVPVIPREPGRQARSAAVVEFGDTAPTTAGTRPFALPLLRDSRLVTTVLGGMIDGVTRMGTPNG